MRLRYLLVASFLCSVTLMYACSEKREPLSPAEQEPAAEPVEVHFSTIQIAYERIVTSYVERPDPAALLDAAWQGAVEAVRAKGGTVTVATPTFSGDPRADLDELRTAYRELTQQAAPRVDPIELSFLAAEAMARSLQDNHTFVMRPAAWRTYRGGGAGRGGAANAGFVPMLVNDTAIVAELVPTGPAARAGVRPGDRILAVDDEPVSGPRALQLSVLSRVLGPEESTVRLTLEREGRGRFEVSLERAPAGSPLLEIRLLPGRIGYLRLRSFPPAIARLSDDGVFADLLDLALRRLQEEGVRGWVLDLRSNGGGDTRSAAQLSGRFVREGQFAILQSRYGRNVINIEGPPLAASLPTAVLVNEGSASAAELVAAVLQEYGVARVFGTKTPGDVNGAQSFELADGGGISVTVARLLTGKERHALDGVGVTPDQIVPLTRADLAANRDPQLNAALAYIRAQVSR